MISLAMGVLAFGLYFLYDINSITWKASGLRCFFGAGTVLLGAATVLDLREAVRMGAFSGAGDWVLLAGAALCFGALIYCLFFALPFGETYVKQDTGSRVCRSGVYGLCRHPGILCFWGMYLLLGLAALPGKLILNALVFSLLDLLYAWFQDRVTFPKTFCDYSDYRSHVPFLFPGKGPVPTAGKGRHRPDNEEDDL